MLATQASRCSPGWTVRTGATAAVLLMGVSVALPARSPAQSCSIHQSGQPTVYVRPAGQGRVPLAATEIARYLPAVTGAGSARSAKR